MNPRRTIEFACTFSIFGKHGVFLSFTLAMSSRLINGLGVVGVGRGLLALPDLRLGTILTLLESKLVGGRAGKGGGGGGGGGGTEINFVSSKLNIRESFPTGKGLTGYLLLRSFFSSVSKEIVVSRLLILSRQVLRFLSKNLMRSSTLHSLFFSLFSVVSLRDENFDTRKFIICGNFHNQSKSHFSPCLG